jgi:hypothetical protein
MPNDSSKWRCEVVIEGRDVIARGIAETEDTARERATEEARKAKLNFPGERQFGELARIAQDVMSVAQPPPRPSRG